MRSSYETTGYWRRYQPWFPREWRCEGDALPSEEWWHWRECEVHIDRFAAPDGPPKVLVLHGGGGYGRLLAPLGIALRGHGYEVLAPDLPGFGLTRVRAKMSISYGDWIECVAALVEAERSRDKRPLVLVGASLGGMLAYEVAARTEAIGAVATTCLLDPREPAVRDAIARNRLTSRIGLPLVQCWRPWWTVFRFRCAWLGGWIESPTILSSPGSAPPTRSAAATPCPSASCAPICNFSPP